MGIGTLIYVYLGFRHVAKDGFLKHLATRAETAGLIRVSLPAGLQQLFFAAGLTAMFWIIGTDVAEPARMTIIGDHSCGEFIRKTGYNRIRYL